MGGATDLARHEAQRLQSATGMTGALLAAAGLTVHDSDITPTVQGQRMKSEVRRMKCEGRKTGSSFPLRTSLCVLSTSLFALLTSLFQYVGKNLKFGPFGDPAVCTVSV